MKETKLLIADDNPGIRRMLEHCLRGDDRQLLTAEDGHAALDLARLHLPNLIILDVRMPGRDGHEVCAELRADERTRLIPIIMLSGLGEPEDELKGINGGADAYMAKPFNLNEFQARVNSLLWRAA